MAIIVALAVLFAVLSPLYRIGYPPCLTPVKTAVWLIKKPATASCLDCHATSGQRITAVFAAKPAATSCADCHSPETVGWYQTHSAWVKRVR